MSAMPKQTKIVITTGALVAALLVAVLVVGIVILNTMNEQAEEQAYRDCLARYGFATDERVPMVTNDEELDAYTNALVAAADECMPD